MMAKPRWREVRESGPEAAEPYIEIWDSNGEGWIYVKGKTRIIGLGNGVEINIWDHAKGKPGIEFTPEAIMERVDEWINDEKEYA